MNNMNNDDLFSIVPSNLNAEWTLEHEKILVEWADKAMCYRWLHSRSNIMYSSLNTWYTIPVIIISTVTGTANFAQERVPLAYQNYFVMVIGAFNILAGIITTIQQFLKITQLNEAHRVASIAWDKFYRNIKIELAKHPDERMNVTQMIKISKEEYDRLMETSPVIPDKIIKKFKMEFKDEGQDIDDDKPKIMPKIIKPEICDSLISTDVYRNKWSSEENQNKKKNQLMSKEKQNLEIITGFQKTFHDLNNRDPLDSEIIDNLKDKIELTVLKKSLENLKNKSSDVNKDNHIEDNTNPNIIEENILNV
jgi:hypothetical protein